AHGPPGHHRAAALDLVRHPHQRGLLRGRARAARPPGGRARHGLLLRHDGARLRAHHDRLGGDDPAHAGRADRLRAAHAAGREAARLRRVGAARTRRPRDARRGGAADRALERLAHRSGRGADQGGLDREGLRERAERASRLGGHGGPRARRPARARRPGGPARRPPPVALHHRADAALRGRHQRDPARHHRAARARPAAEVGMQLAPTEEQEAIRQAARRFLAAEITRERRLAWDRTAEGHDPAFWEAVARLGWFGYGLPAAYGGQGASLLDLGLLIEELGRAAAPFGVFAAIVGGLALTALGTPAQKRAWLPAMARGEKLVTLAVAEESASADPAAFATVVRRRGAAWPRFTALRTRLAALLCADMIGGADAVLEMTTRYVCEREQFGVKLGTFQAVQQMVAVMAIELEGARHVTRQALWRLAEGLPAAREVAVAKAWTGRAYREATLIAHQLHGGAGYVIEHELHRYSARAKEAELRFGSTEEWLETLADELRLARDGARPR